MIDKVSVVYPMDQSISSTISSVAARGVAGIYAPEFLRMGKVIRTGSDIEPARSSVHSLSNRLEPVEPPVRLFWTGRIEPATKTSNRCNTMKYNR
jgi:hypothetical protein